MKKIFTATLIFMMVTCFALQARAEKDMYMFGVFWDQDARQTATFNMISKDISKAISDSMSIELSNLYYQDLERFHEDIATQKLDLIYANTEDDFLLAIMYGYDPISTLSIFGKQKVSSCLFVRQDSEISDISGLDGKKLVTYPHQTAYTLLRQLMKKPPEKTFAEMTTSTNAFNTVDALVSGEADVVFLVETNIDYFKIVNPAPVKKIRKLACAEEQYLMPVMVSPQVPEEFITGLEEFYPELMKNESLKMYRAFMKQIDLKVIPVSAEDYEPFFKLYDFSLANGWDKDFEKWLETSNTLE